MAATEQEHAEILAQVNRELQEFGQILPGTRASLDSVGKGGKALQVGMEAAGKAAVDIGKAYTAAAAAMYNGEKGMKAYNKSIDAGADAVGALAATAGAAAAIMGVMTGGIGFLVAAVGLAAAGLAKYAKAANEQSDALFDSYQKLSRIGAAGADSLQGIYNDMQKLGLGVQDLDKFVGLVAGSSKELAMMSGSVIKGRKAYAEVSAGMDKFKLSLLNSGMTQDEINEGTIDYLRLQSRAGLTQKKSVDDLATSTTAYLKEQDALTQLTGLTRKEQSDQRERLRNDEAFGSQVAAMRLSQDQKQIAAAEQMEKSVMMMSVYNEKAAEGMRDLASGNLQTEAAQQLMRASNGEGMRAMHDLKAGIINAEQAFDRIAEANIRTVTAQGKVLGGVRVYNKAYGDAAGDFRLAAARQAGTMVDAARENYEQRKKMGAEDGKALSEEQQRQAELVKTQQNSMHNMQDFVRYGVTPATEATAWFAKTVEAATSLLPNAGKYKEEMQFEKNLKDAEAENKKILIAMEKQKTSTNKREIETAKLAEKAAREKRELLDKEREELLKVSKYFKAPGEKAGIGGVGARQGGVGMPPGAVGARQGSAGKAPVPGTNRTAGGSTSGGGGGGGTAGGSSAAVPATSAAAAAAAAKKVPPAAAPAQTAPHVSATGRTGDFAKTDPRRTDMPNTALGSGMPGYSVPSVSAATQLKKIRDMIGLAESFGGNYNAVVGEKNQNFGLTSMTLDEINQFQRQRLREGKGTPVGKYQMKIDTLQEMARGLGIKGNQKFDEETQDKLADFLIRGRGGYDQYARNPTPEGKARLLANLARIWAGLPRGPDNLSYYDNDGKNKAHKDLPWAKALESFGDGGIVHSPTFAQIGEKGSEAVIPLKNGSVPVTMPRDFIRGMSKYQLVLDQIKDKFEETSGRPGIGQILESQGLASALPNTEAMLTAFRAMSDELKAQGAANRSLFESMLSIQKSSNDIQSKMLRYVQN
jgi:hypothetical protein